MKKNMQFFKCFLLIICMIGVSQAFSRSVVLNKLEQWLKSPQSKRKSLLQCKWATTSLSEEEAFRASVLLQQDWQKQMRQRYEKVWQDSIIAFDGRTMKFFFKSYGTEKFGHRSLYISMHGGGNTAPQVNDGQWNNQKLLYMPQQGIYVAPRAPQDDWNMWFKDYMFGLFDNLIVSAVTVMGVDPNKVYITGYSAGGDGTYRLAPIMADSWAAAAMMAGHPGNVSPKSLRNLPFTLWVGEQDKAYDRDKEGMRFGKELDELQKEDPQGYIHWTQVCKNKGHWMERLDTAGFNWMSQFSRNPYPCKIVWRQDLTDLRSHFYWLQKPLLHCRKGDEVVAQIKDNTVYIKGESHGITVLLNDNMLDLERPVTVISNGKKIVHKKLKRNVLMLYSTLYERNDACYMFPAGVTL